MKVNVLYLLAITLLLTGCGQSGNTPVGTIFPTKEIEKTIYIGTVAMAPATVSLNDFPDKEFVGEDEKFAIYLTNITGGNENVKTGEIIVHDKTANQITKINGLFTVIMEGTIVYDDGKGEYILLSIGSYTSRNAIVISLTEKKQAVKDFCISSEQYGSHLFWKNFIILNNCDAYSNRPWGAGEAPSVASINLKTGEEVIIAKSDLTHEYHVKVIEGNTLQYIETFVENEADWINPDKHKTEEKTFDLSSLEN
jgi:hypothetical protein